jgi:hypothetical protein
MGKPVLDTARLHANELIEADTNQNVQIRQKKRKTLLHVRETAVHVHHIGIIQNGHLTDAIVAVVELHFATQVARNAYHLTSQ